MQSRIVGSPYLIALGQSSASERSRPAADAGVRRTGLPMSGEEAPMTRLRKNCATLRGHPTSFSSTPIQG